MKNLKKLLLLFLLAIPVITFAKADISERIKSLRAERSAIMEQVKAGEITKNEAVVLWSQKMDEIQNIKEAGFASRIEKIQEKFTERAKKNPEQAELILGRLKEIIDLLTAQKADLEAFKTELKIKIDSGAITRAEAKQLRKAKYDELKAIRKAKRGEFRESHKAKRAERQAARKLKLKARRDEIKAKLASGEMTIEEAKLERDAFRKEKKERLEALKEKNITRYNEIMEKQNQ